MMRSPYALGFSLGIFLYVATECAIYVWMPTLLGSTTFSAAEVVDLGSLASKMKQPSRPFDTWLSTQLSPTAKEALAKWQGQGSEKEALQQALLSDFNTNVIPGVAIFEPGRFAGIALRDETKKLIGENPRGSNLERLNRLLTRGRLPAGIVEEPAPDERLWLPSHVVCPHHVLRSARRRTFHGSLGARALQVDVSDGPLQPGNSCLLCGLRCGRKVLCRLAPPFVGTFHVHDLSDAQFERHQLFPEDGTRRRLRRHSVLHLRRGRAGPPGDGSGQ